MLLITSVLVLPINSLSPAPCTWLPTTCPPHLSAATNLPPASHDQCSMQHLGATYSQAASRCCHLLPRSISVLPGLNTAAVKNVQSWLWALSSCTHPYSCALYTHTTPKQHLGASSLSVLPTTQQPLGAVAYYPAASRCCRLLPSSLSVLSPTTQQPLGAAYYPTASRCCRLIPSSILVLPPTTQQHLGAVAYYPAASRCCLLPSSISVLPTTQQHLGAAAYYPAASRCCLLIAYPHAAAQRCHTRSISIPYICLVLPTPQHPGAAHYQTASRCCRLPSSISVLPPTTKQHPSAAY